MPFGEISFHEPRTGAGAVCGGGIKAMQFKIVYWRLGPCAGLRVGWNMSTGRKPKRSYRRYGAA
jgi:hypothetical protein